MAYVNQERKAQLAPGIKAVFKKYGIKGTIAVRNHMTLVVTIKSGMIDFISNYNSVRKENEWKQVHPGQDAIESIDVNTYWYHEHFDGVARKCLSELITAMNVGNHNNSDSQSDYFDVGWYIDINIGKWNKPYVVTA